VSAWIVPYVDQDLAFWQEVRDRFGDQIQEVYFPLPGGRFASGRAPQPEQFLDSFLQHAPLPKAAVVNPIVLDRPVEQVAPQVVDRLRQLRDECGLRGVTVANLALAGHIKEALPDLAVVASVLMGVSSPAQALVAGDYLDALGPDTRLVRDLRGLRQLRAAFPGEIRLLVNEACLPGCLFRAQHFYEMAYGQAFPESLCQQVLEARPWLRLTGAWILPRHLHFYDGLYDSLKLAGRVTLRDPERYLAVLDAYVHRRPTLPRDIGGGPASPLNGIDVSDEWFEHVLNCDKRCDTCLVCRQEWHRACSSQEEKNL
jgi:hypothetical protein